MLNSRPLVIQGLRWNFRTLCHSQLLHRSRKGAESLGNFKASQPRLSQNPSLLEELFPEEVQKDGVQDPNFLEDTQTMPRLPLPEVDDVSEGYSHESDRERVQPYRVTKIAAANAFRRQQVAVLSLDMGSKSLIESDFRRIAPKGQHIDDWTGPGDILKIIPVRNPRTLESAGRYFILFPNAAYARTYQNHVVRLHRIAKTHTPTSIESPLPLQPGVVIEGEDAYKLLQDYSLCPPSQKIQLNLLSPPYAVGFKQILDQRGYRPLLGDTNKTGRSVLFSVDGQHLPTSVIKHMITADGRDRGLAWDMSIDRPDTSEVPAESFEASTSRETGEIAEIGPKRHVTSRWVISFSDENEARRFIRAWHRRPFPSARGDDPTLIQAEFIW